MEPLDVLVGEAIREHCDAAKQRDIREVTTGYNSVAKVSGSGDLGGGNESYYTDHRCAEDCATDLRLRLNARGIELAQHLHVGAER